MLNSKNEITSCSLGYAVTIFNGKWKPYIIWYLNSFENGTCRYGELKRNLPWDITKKVLTEQLKEMECDGLLTRTEHPEESVPRVEYTQTNKGRYFVPVVQYLRDWGALFGENKKAHILKTTQGKWEGNEIVYQYTDQNASRAIEMRFNVGFSAEDL